MDIKKQQRRAKYNRITQLEERIDYLEGVIYQMFQLTEKLLLRLENCDGNETTQLYQSGSSDMTVLD
jgi:hypothetical protein